MIQELKYNGHTANSSDFECNDGDLAVAYNVVPEDGTLKPVLSPSTVATFSNKTLLYIHSTDKYKHYILKGKKNNKIYWQDYSGTKDTEFGELENIKSINAIGNTLLVFTDNAINYFLWKENGYTFLGDHIPEIDISFGLRGTPKFLYDKDTDYMGFTINFADFTGDKYQEWSLATKNYITSAVMSEVNKFLADNSTLAGKFALPFFVRYALRLYDGSLTHHSAPILMMPITGAPVVYTSVVTEIESSVNKHKSCNCAFLLTPSRLDYAAGGSIFSIKEIEEKWSDIVKEVDVFISAPIYPYNQDGLCTKFEKNNGIDNKFVGALDFKGFINRVSGTKEDKISLPLNVNGTDMKVTDTPTDNGSPLYDNYTEWLYEGLIHLYYSSTHMDMFSDDIIRLPEISNEEFNRRLSEVSNFYYLTTLSFADLRKPGRRIIDIKGDYLESLVAREQMSDDYDSHNRIAADYSYIYNNRLNLAGIKKRMFDRFDYESMFCYVNNEIDHVEFSGIKTGERVVNFTNSYNKHLTIYVYCKIDGQTFVINRSVQSSELPFFLSNLNKTPDRWNAKVWGSYVYFPNPNAFEMRIKDDRGWYSIPLKPHPFLNGAYGLLDFNIFRENMTLDPISAKQNAFIDFPNKLYTSEINNPFVFPVTGINSIGMGKILGIASATKALSEGQFGMFPLYAFTDDGVWALEVSQTGSFSSKQPISRDVCINPDSITQIDNAVLFATDRGIMLIQGSETICISDTINSPYPFGITDLPKSEALVYISHLSLGPGNTLKPLPFLEFIKNGSMLYDYVNQHIILFHPTCRYSYVFSLISKQWGMTLSQIQRKINAYPEGLGVYEEAIRVGSVYVTNDILVNFSKPDTTLPTNVLVVTRPFKFAEPNVFKTIDTIIQRGFFDGKKMKQVLYGSNDLVNWHTVWSSNDKYLRGFRGTPYKVFRLAIICTLEENESIYGCTVQFTPRMLNRPR